MCLFNALFTIGGSVFVIMSFLSVLASFSIQRCNAPLQASCSGLSVSLYACPASFLMHPCHSGGHDAPSAWPCRGLQGVAARLQQVFLGAGDAAASSSGGAAGAAVPAAGSRELYDDDLDAGGPAAGAALCASQCPGPSAISVC